MNTKNKLYATLLFLTPVFIFFTFNYLDIPKKIFIDTIFFFNDHKNLSLFFFIFLYLCAILFFLPLGVFFHIIAGIIFEPLFGYLYSLLAILTATSISFYVSQKNFTFFIKKKKKYFNILKRLNLSNNEILNIFLLRLTFFIPISIQNILSVFVTKNLNKLLFVTIVTTSPPMLAIIISANKIKDNFKYDQFESIELMKIYIVLFFSLIAIHLIRILINLSINKSKKLNK